MSLKKIHKLFYLAIIFSLFSLACALPVANSPTPTVNNIPVTTQSADPIITEQPDPAVTDQPLVEITPEPTAKPIPSGIQVGLNHISFYYDPSVVASIEPVGVAANPPDPMGASWESHPSFSQFNFTGYILQGTFHTPIIEVYPIQEYAAMNEGAKNSSAALIELLKTRPSNPTSIPFLPVFNAAQMMVSNVTYIDFEGGSGVRFLTQYGQAFYPINNHSLFYTFQGMTDDQKYYIAAILPVNNSILPADDQIPNNDFETFSNTFDAYIIDIQNQLNAQPNESFTPNLTLLDTMMQSIVEEIQ